MYPPISKNKIVFDQSTFLYQDVLISSWKEKDRISKNREMFNAYYMFNMHIISYNGDKIIQVAIDGKYAVRKAIDLLLTNTKLAWVLNNNLCGSEFDLVKIQEQNKHSVYVFDPVKEENKRWEY